MESQTNNSIAESNSAIGKVVLSEQEFCAAIGISRTTCWRLRKQGQIAYLQLERRVAFLPRHIDEYLNRCEVKPRQRIPARI